MRLDRDARAQGPLIAGIVRGGFRVDYGVYRALTLTPERADAWTPPPLETLDVAAFEPLLALDPQPEFVILGTGATLRRPPRSLEAALPFGIEPMDSRAAARAWGVLRAEQRWIAAALYPLD